MKFYTVLAFQKKFHVFCNMFLIQIESALVLKI